MGGKSDQRGPRPRPAGTVRAEWNGAARRSRACRAAARSQAGAPTTPAWTGEARTTPPRQRRPRGGVAGAVPPQKGPAETEWARREGKAFPSPSPIPSTQCLSYSLDPMPLVRPLTLKESPKKLTGRRLSSEVSSLISSFRSIGGTSQVLIPNNPGSSGTRTRKLTQHWI